MNRLCVTANRAIETANILAPRDACPHPDRVMNVHDLFFITRGEWEVMQENERYTLTPGDIVLLFAGRHHFGGRPFSPGTAWIYMHFEPALGDRFLSGSSRTSQDPRWVDVPTRAHVEPGDHRIKAMFEEIVFCHWSSSIHNRARASVLTTELLIELGRLGAPERDALAASPVQHVIDLIERSPKKTHSLDDLARTTGMSEKQLTYRFRKATGTSIRQYQLRFKMRVACSLLRANPFLSVRAVADELGFFDEFHFSKRFKQDVGVSPSAYRVKAGVAR